MLKTVRKQNKVLRVDESVVDAYLAEGYDEIDKSGKTIRSSSVRTYTAAEFAAVKSEYEAKITELEAKIAKLTKKSKSEKSENAEDTEQSE